MKKYALAAAFSLIAGAAFADPIEGMWKTAPDDNGNTGIIQVVPCGKGFCGTLVKAYDPAGKQITTKNVGRKIVWDMRAGSGGAYDGGKVYAPDRGKTYSGKMKLSGDKLSVSGCVIGMCREGGKWSRVK